MITDYTAGQDPASGFTEMNDRATIARQNVVNALTAALEGVAVQEVNSLAFLMKILEESLVNLAITAASYEEYMDILTTGIDMYTTASTAEEDATIAVETATGVVDAATTTIEAVSITAAIDYVLQGSTVALQTATVGLGTATVGLGETTSALGWATNTHTIAQIAEMSLELAFVAASLASQLEEFVLFIADVLLRMEEVIAAAALGEANIGQILGATIANIIEPVVSLSTSMTTLLESLQPK